MAKYAGWVNQVAVFSALFNKKKKILPLGKLCSKLLCVKSVTLNSLLILRKNSAQQIDICSILIKRVANSCVARDNFLMLISLFIYLFIFL